MAKKSKRAARILLVDHDEDWLRSTQSTLETLNYVVQTARSADEALALGDQTYDLILMNWVLTSQEQVLLDGLVRSKSPNPRCVVVMFPVQQLPERMRLVFKAGAYDCVDKPSDQEELIELIKTLRAECVLPKDD